MNLPPCLMGGPWGGGGGWTITEKFFLVKTRQPMDGEENEQMGVGEDWVCFDVEKEYVGEEDEVL